ncbi:hypothetical protein [Cohnella rhizosphaerae]|uniref:Uncharacterized protein n=1 Tax=Cohnella rhizosphaerae TaxID=1457232 RepID=A0A9X4L4P5_9BACL|nr:hypothetical protein [Cohnella rhizosphaerae]MDG0813412.1 hypothetical protein [Cohnella rhizosphaerae]
MTLCPASSQLPPLGQIPCFAQLEDVGGQRHPAFAFVVLECAVAQIGDRKSEIAGLRRRFVQLAAQHRERERRHLSVDLKRQIERLPLDFVFVFRPPLFERSQIPRRRFGIARIQMRDERFRLRGRLVRARRLSRGRQGRGGSHRPAEHGKQHEHREDRFCGRPSMLLQCKSSPPRALIRST